MAESQLCVADAMHTLMTESLGGKNVSAPKNLRVGDLSHLMRRVRGESHLSRAVHIWMTESSQRKKIVSATKTRATLIQ